MNSENDFGDNPDIRQTGITPRNIGLVILLTLVGVLVYIFAGYNNIPDDNVRIAIKIFVPIILSIPIAIFEMKKLRLYRDITIGFFSISIGLLLARFLGTWYSYIPGITPGSIEEAALAKFAEVLPIVIPVIIISIAIGTGPVRELKHLSIVGGNIPKSILLVIIFTPLAIIQFLLMGGLAVTVTLETIISWMPWFLLFAISNAFMEELIFRGLFLKKYENLFGDRIALIQTSFIFAIFHIAILSGVGLEIAISFLMFIFVLGLAWGYMVQKTDSIWGAVIAHMIADILLLITVFGVV